jgi:hypothetical protein
LALLGRAAMVLAFDVAPEAVEEHDDWHTHEHLPERLSIPGFLRGSRWTRESGEATRYFVLYEVRELEVLKSAAYLERLNHPTPWTSKMMRHYRGMCRSFCRVESSSGRGIGHWALLARYPQAAASPGLLTAAMLEDLPSTPGFASTHAFVADAPPAMTEEQKIRGRDASDSRVVLVTGYNAAAVTSLHEASRDGGLSGVYRLDYSLTDREAA